MKINHIRPLTSLRFAAALLVFMHHWGVTSNLDILRSFGTIGVGFFFMLSGLILAHVYSERLRLEGYRSFYIGRIARILPVHLVTAVIASIVFTLPLTIRSVVQVILNIPLLQAYFPLPGIYFSLNQPSWSLSDEMFFYTLFPFVLPIIINTTYRQAIYLIVIIAIFTLAWAMLWSGLRWRTIELDHWAVYIFPPARFVEFVAGITLWRLLSRAKLSRFVATILELTSIAILTFLIFNYDAFTVSQQYAFAFFFPCLLLLAIFFLSSGMVSTILSWRPLVYLGEISFAFYMIHYVVVQNLRGVDFAVTLTLTIACASALHHLVEIPAQKYITKRWKAHSDYVRSKPQSKHNT